MDKVANNGTSKPIVMRMTPEQVEVSDLSSQP